MPAWSFQPRFRFALANGLAQARNDPIPYPAHPIKRQTIRALRRDGLDPRPAQRVRIWVAQRTPEREFLGETPPVLRHRIEIPHARSVVLELRWLTHQGQARLAQLDGFTNPAELFEFIATVHGFPFAGYCFRW